MGQERAPISVPVLEELRPHGRLPRALRTEIQTLTSLPMEIEELYDEIVFIDAEAPIWEIKRSEIPRDLTLKVHWEKSREHPYSPTISSYTRSHEWIDSLKERQIQSVYESNDDLWIPHNWLFFKRHFLHGGDTQKGGTVFSYDLEGYKIYRQRKYVGRFDFDWREELKSAHPMAVASAVRSGRLTREEASEAYDSKLKR